jgi:hypothetical protein
VAIRFFVTPPRYGFFVFSALFQGRCPWLIYYRTFGAQDVEIKAQGQTPTALLSLLKIASTSATSLVILILGRLCRKSFP